MRPDDANEAVATDGGTAIPTVRPDAPPRERLLAGMALSVATQGYLATSVADVLHAARVSRRTFYQRFADKEDCFLAAYDAFVAICEARVRAACAGASSWQEGVERGLTALLAALAAEPAFTRLGIVEVLASGPRGGMRREETLRRFVDLVGRTPTPAPEAVEPPSELLRQAVVGGIYEVLYSHIIRGEIEQLPTLATALRHYTFMLLGPRAAPS